MGYNGKILKEVMDKLDKPSKVRLPKNQWQTPGQVTPVYSNSITMQGVGFDAIGMSPGGYKQYMENGKDYYFPTTPVVEVPLMANGGYTVTRSSDRKGKTHKVTGPDGTVKYFGDSKLGQHPKDPERKKAFYARHKKNLAGNPYFRAFARKTWEDGGSINMMQNGGGLLNRSVSCSNCGHSWAAVDGGKNPLTCHKCGGMIKMQNGGNQYIETMKTNYGKGGEMIRRANGSYSRKGLWDYIRENEGSGKEPTKEMLEQERKIKAKEMKYGGINNAGFDALPSKVKAQIIAGMAYGGEKMPPEIARARFAAAGNLNKMGDYGYAYGGYIPDMMYGGYDYMAEGGEANGEMALGQMAAVSDKMAKLLKYVKPEQNLDPWIASKLAVMDHSANAITDYMMYGPEAYNKMAKMQEGGNIDEMPSPEEIIQAYAEYSATPEQDIVKELQARSPEEQQSMLMQMYQEIVEAQQTDVPEPNDQQQPEEEEEQEVEEMEEQAPQQEAPTEEEDDDDKQYDAVFRTGGYIGYDGKRKNSKTPTWSGNAGYKMGGGLPKAQVGIPKDFGYGMSLGNNRYNMDYDFSATQQDGRVTSPMHALKFAMPSVFGSQAGLNLSGNFGKNSLGLGMGSRIPVGSGSLNINGAYNQSRVEQEPGFSMKSAAPAKKNFQVSADYTRQLGSKGPTLKVRGYYGAPDFAMGGYIPEFTGGGYTNKYKQGGPAIGQEMDVTPEQIKQLRAQGYQFEII
jgi:ribosomal protein S27E